MGLDLGITLLPWQDQAACRFEPLDVRRQFIAEDYKDGEPSRLSQQAFDVCALRCPVASQCREWVDRMEKRSTDFRTLAGIYAAETPKMRALRRQRENKEMKTETVKARGEMK